MKTEITKHTDGMRGLGKQLYVGRNEGDFEGT